MVVMENGLIIEKPFRYSYSEEIFDVVYDVVMWGIKYRENISSNIELIKNAMKEYYYSLRSLPYGMDKDEEDFNKILEFYENEEKFKEYRQMPYKKMVDIKWK